jgi:general secretion pathway protein D
MLINPEHSLKFVFSLLLAALLSVCVNLPASAEEKLTINMRDADIRALIQWVADFTGRSMIVHKDVQGKVTVLSTEPVTNEEAYQVFLSTLEVHGFTAVDTGAATRIIPSALAKSSPTALGGGSGAQPVVNLFKLHHVPVAQVVNSIKPLVSPDGYVSAHPATNSLVISDTASNIKRISELLRRLDRSGQLEFELVRIQHASAQDIYESIRQLLPGAQNENLPGLINLSVDERTNSLLISGDSETRKQVRQLVRQLDGEVSGTGNSEVIYLHYVDAQEMLEILKGTTKAFEEENKEQSGKVNIGASASTNALVVNAPPIMIQRIKRIVEQIDIRRAQVLVESLVVEVTDEFANDLGVAWYATEGENLGDDGGAAAVSTLGNLASGVVTDDTGNTSFVPGRGLSLGYFENDDLRAVIRALNASTEANILSTPTIVAMDNEQASLLVGQNVPFKTGESTGEANDTSNPFITIERQDIGISLDITPRINHGDSITLEINQKTERIAPSIENASDIITNKRFIKTKALIKDGQTLVLGGLIRDEDGETREKVPLLGDIPLLGKAFSSTGKRRVKTNLMVFIHPVILKDDEQLEDLTRQRYNFMREQQVLASEDNRNAPETGPLLPEFTVYQPSKSPEPAPADN